MKRDDFRRWLEGLGLGAKAVTNRICWCNKIEEDFNIDLDNICKSDTKMNRLMEEIDHNSVYKKGEKKNLTSSLKKYIEYVKKS